MSILMAVVSLLALAAYVWGTLYNPWLVDVVDRWVGTDPGRIFLAIGIWLIGVSAAWVATLVVVGWLGG